VNDPVNVIAPSAGAIASLPAVRITIQARPPEPLHLRAPALGASARLPNPNSTEPPPAAAPEDSDG
jgi:hypothetical protein